ncbi:cyclic nucleotide-binding domain-containing protein [Methylocella sp.]|uniref:cyclic nucleotide-binding domain-containing protein n=1 Tax=Methylocella sp. TaxID=1978226 RepID=UPI003C28C3EF
MPPWPALIVDYPQTAVAIAALVVAAGSLFVLAVRRGPMWRLAGRIGLLVALSAMLLSHGIEPYRQRLPDENIARQLGILLLEILWWVALARVLVSVVDAFVIFERRPNESRLFQQLIAGLIYLGVALAIIGDEFNVPIGALFATSGAVAIIAGLALQSTLADVFSGIAISLGRSYRIGDWIIIDGGVEGRIIETNWQAVHLLTASHDVAIIPNSVLAKAKLVNVTTPEEMQVATTLIRFEPSMSPASFVDMSLQALASCNCILHQPPPTVAVKSLSASAIELAVSYRIPNRSAGDDARNEVFDRVYRHAVAAGLKFAQTPGVAGLFAPMPTGADGGGAPPQSAPERILEKLPLFASLTEEHKTVLAAKMRRRTFERGELVIERGVVAQTLAIVESGALALYQVRDAREHELVRLGPGDYFGEGGLLLGEPQRGTIRALTHASIYEIVADDLRPILVERPGLSDALGHALAARRAMQAADDAAVSNHADHSARRLTDRIRQLFQVDA